MRILKWFSLTVAVVLLTAAVAVAFIHFDPPLFSSFLVLGMMALAYYYFERWYERWLHESRS
ncbi:MAG: respiratory chain protein [Pyrobaculum sp.]